MRKAQGDKVGELDLRGLRCPLPALRTERHLGTLASGEEVAVLADDPLARIDIGHLCRKGGHALLDVAQAGGHLRFLIRRK